MLDCDELVRHAAARRRCLRVGQRWHRVGVERRLGSRHLAGVAEGEADVAAGVGRQVADQLDCPRKRPAAGHRSDAPCRESVVQVGRVEQMHAVGRHVELGVCALVIQGVKGVVVVEDDPDILRAVAGVLVGGRDGLKHARQQPVVVQSAVVTGDLDRADGTVDAAVGCIAEVGASCAGADATEEDGCSRNDHDGRDSDSVTSVFHVSQLFCECTSTFVL